MLKKPRFKRTRSAILLTAIMIAPASVQAADRTLYDDLGGHDGVTAIISGLLDYTLDDDRIAHTFDNSDVERVERLLVEQICELSGGPCTYSGVSMAKSHRGLDLNMMHFNALVENLQRAMRDEDISNGTQNRLLALLAPMKPDVVDAIAQYDKEKAELDKAAANPSSDPESADP